MSDTPVSKYNSLNYFIPLFYHTKENSVLLMDEEGTILEVNNAFVSVFGYEKEDVEGKNFKMLFTEEDRARGLPVREVTNVLNRGQAFDNNYLLQKNKIATWVSGESILVKDDNGKIYILKIIQNINAQKISENSIISLNDFNDSILRSIEDGVVVLNKELNIVKANDAFLRLFNIAAAGINDTSFGLLIAPHDKNKELYHKIMMVISSKKGFSHALVQLNANTDNEKILEVSCSPLKDQSADSNILLIFNDVTVQKQAERDRDDMLGFIGHELRNPMTSVLLSHNLMEELIHQNNTVVIKEIMERSKKNIMRLNKMVTELYNSTKINAGQFELEITVFNFAEMIGEAVDTIKIFHPGYTIVVNNKAEDIIAAADRHRLIQVVTNYLSNSIKYAAAAEDITITVTAATNLIKVAVKDHGPGIAKEQLPFIFDRFFRAEKTMNLEGIGLGLFLCKQIIHAHNGNVWAESEEGKGSTFYFSVPYISK
jgi:two-component system, OmpR family, phosphate regulon sensor histidine kinase PhoR